MTYVWIAGGIALVGIVAIFVYAFAQFSARRPLLPLGVHLESDATATYLIMHDGSRRKILDHPASPQEVNAVKAIAADIILGLADERKAK